MAGQTIVFFPRYTTLVTGTYFSDPYDVTRYKSIEAQTLNAAVINSATLSVQLQQSSDLVTWTDVGSAMAPAVNDTDVESLSGTARYIRAKATIAGTNATAVFWAKAVARDC